MINYTIAACLASALIGSVVTYGLFLNSLRRAERYKQVLRGLHNRYDWQKSGTARYVAKTTLRALVGVK